MLHRLRTRLHGRRPTEIAALAVKNLSHALRRFTPAARAARAADDRFDRLWGTDTSAGLSGRELGFGADQLADYYRYDPSSEAMIRDPVATLHLDPADWHFVDYGAGKGRVVMTAMAMGFARVTGVELSGRLCAIAASNIALFADKHGGVIPAAIVQTDATAFAPAGDRLLAYFYNPFGPAILSQVRDRLAASGAREVIVIYANPQHAEVFAAPDWHAGPTWPNIASFRYAADM